MVDKLLAEHHLEFLSLKAGCTGLSESIHVKMPHCWNSHIAAQMIILTHIYVWTHYHSIYSIYPGTLFRSEIQQYKVLQKFTRFIPQQKYCKMEHFRVTKFSHFCLKNMRINICDF